MMSSLMKRCWGAPTRFSAHISSRLSSPPLLKRSFYFLPLIYIIRIHSSLSISSDVCSCWGLLLLFVRQNGRIASLSSLNSKLYFILLLLLLLYIWFHTYTTERAICIFILFIFCCCQVAPALYINRILYSRWVSSFLFFIFSKRIEYRMALCLFLYSSLYSTSD